MKRELQLIDRELTDLGRLRWKYSKRMLRFGTASWLFGICTFVAALLIYQGPGVVTGAPPLSISLLIIAAAAPIFITVVVIRKFSKRIAHLEQLRRGLLGEYERALLKEVGKLVSG